MKTGMLLGVSLVAILALPVQAAETAGPAEEIQAYCDEQADAAGLSVGDEARTAFVKMCVDSETRTAAAEGKGGGDD